MDDFAWTGIILVVLVGIMGVIGIIVFYPTHQETCTALTTQHAAPFNNGRVNVSCPSGTYNPYIGVPSGCQVRAGDTVTVQFHRIDDPEIIADSAC